MKDLAKEIRGTASTVDKDGKDVRMNIKEADREMKSGHLPQLL